MPRTKDSDREYAKMLYLDKTRNLTQKEIAGRVGVRPNTVGDWIKKHGWDKEKKSLLITKQESIVDLYDQLNALLTHIKTRKVIHDIPVSLIKPIKVKDAEGNESLESPEINEEDFPILVSNYPTSKEANQIAQLTAAIQKLETETSVSEIIDSSREFLEWLKPQDHDLMKKMIPLYDAFINQKL